MILILIDNFLLTLNLINMLIFFQFNVTIEFMEQLICLLYAVGWFLIILRSKAT